MTETASFEVGQTVFIQMVEMTMHDERLAYVPDEAAKNFIDAYRASLFTTRQAAQEAVEADWASELAAYQEEEGEAFDPETHQCEEFVAEGVVQEDGSITFLDRDPLTAEQIWGRYELPVPGFGLPQPKSR